MEMSYMSVLHMVPWSLLGTEEHSSWYQGKSGLTLGWIAG